MIVCLDDWLSEERGSKDAVGFAGCGADYLETFVDPGNLISIPSELLGYTDEPISQEHVNLGNSLAQQLDNLPENFEFTSDNHHYSKFGPESIAAIYNAVINAANDECSSTDNCCSSIRITFQCSPALSEVFDRNKAAFQNTPMEKNYDVENPCGKTVEVFCN